jgi:hypothetical protein
MKLWAQVNLGHCGGYWFMSICRAHLDIMAWAEAPTNHKYSPELKPGETLVDYIEREHRRGFYKSMGFIKSQSIVPYCAEHGRVVRFVRNPIEVAGKKTRQYWQGIVDPGPKTPDLTQHVETVEKHLGRAMKTEMDHFEGYVMELARLHRWLVSGLPRRWPLVRLETFDHSIGTDGVYFLRVMEYLTQVPWQPSLVEIVRETMLPNPPFVETGVLDQPPHEHWSEHGWLYDPLPLLRWRTWDKQRRQIFLTHFEHLMLRLGYGWPNNV